MWAEHIVSSTSLRHVSGGDGRRFAFDIRLNWSRSIPMSCLEELAVRLDGDPITAFTVAQGGEDLALDRWADRDDVWWPVLTPATVTATAPQAVAEGTHRLDLELRVRVPAFPPGPDGTWPTRYNRASVAEVIR